MGNEHAGSAIECVADCRSCWWQEGGRCYIGTPERLSDGRSTKMAEGRCDGYWNKRKALTTVIPGDKLVIASEEGEVPCPKCNPPAKLK